MFLYFYSLTLSQKLYSRINFSIFFRVKEFSLFLSYPLSSFTLLCSLFRAHISLLHRRAIALFIYIYFRSMLIPSFFLCTSARETRRPSFSIPFSYGLVLFQCSFIPYFRYYIPGNLFTRYSLRVCVHKNH